MGKIIAIGGGEIGRAGYPIETTKIDKEIIKLAGKKTPNFLFIPTASNDSELYIKTVEKYFGSQLGCKVKPLCLVKNPPAVAEIKKIIFGSDIIYVGGGNTFKMLKIWRKLGVDKILEEAYKSGIVLSGLSAGAICWFSYGSSDLGKVKNSANGVYKKIKGLGFLNFTASPHHIREKGRRGALIKIMRKTSGVGLAIDDCAAFEVVNDKYRVIMSKPNAKIHKVYIEKGKLNYQQIQPSKKFQPLSQL